MYPKYMSYRDLEFQVQELEKRRKLIEQSFNERRKLVNDLKEKEVQSHHRLIQLYQEQNQKAKQRNKSFLEEISLLSSNIQLQKDLIKIKHSRNENASSSASVNYLINAKKNYEMHYEAALPLYHREQTHKMEESFRKIQITKLQTKHRHELLRQELLKEQAMKNRLYQQKQELLQILTLEQKDLMEARINKLLMEEENKLIQKELQQYIVSEGYRLERQVRDQLGAFQPSEFLNLPEKNSLPMPNVEERRQSMDHIRELLSSSLNAESPEQNFAFPLQSNFSQDTKTSAKSIRNDPPSSVNPIASNAAQNLLEMKKAVLHSMAMEEQQPVYQQLTQIGSNSAEKFISNKSSSFLEDKPISNVPVHHDNIMVPRSEKAGMSETNSHSQKKSMLNLNSMSYDESEAPVISSRNTKESHNQKLQSQSQDNFLFALSESQQNSPSHLNNKLQSRSRSEFNFQGEGEEKQEATVLNMDRNDTSLYNSFTHPPEQISVIEKENSQLQTAQSHVDNEFDVINSSNNTSNQSHQQLGEEIAMKITSERLSQISNEVLIKVLNKCYQFIESRLTGVTLLSNVYSFESIRLHESIFSLIIENVEEINQEFWQERGMTEKQVGNLVLAIIEGLSGQLLPSSVFGGVVTMEKLKKELKKKNGLLLLFDNLINHLKLISSRKPSWLEDLTSCFTATMIEHVPKDDRDRMNRKVSKLLQLGIIPDDTESPVKKPLPSTSFFPTNPNNSWQQNLNTSNPPIIIESEDNFTNNLQPTKKISTVEKKPKLDFSLDLNRAEMTKLAELDIDEIAEDEELEKPPAIKDLGILHEPIESKKAMERGKKTVVVGSASKKPVSNDVDEFDF